MMGTVVAYRIDHLPHVMCDATNIIYWVKKVSYFHCASYEMLTTPSIAEVCVCVCVCVCVWRKGEMKSTAVHGCSLARQCDNYARSSPP